MDGGWSLDDLTGVRSVLITDMKATTLGNCVSTVPFALHILWRARFSLNSSQAPGTTLLLSLRLTYFLE